MQNDFLQVGVIGENLVLRRCASLYVPEGLVLPYVHNSMASGMGTIGVLLGYSFDLNNQPFRVST
jgi:elongation factor Ts